MRISQAAPDRVVFQVPTIIPLVLNLHLVIPNQIQLGLGYLQINSEILSRQIQWGFDTRYESQHNCHDIYKM